MFEIVGQKQYFFSSTCPWLSWETPSYLSLGWVGEKEACRKENK